MKQNFILIIMLLINTSLISHNDTKNQSFNSKRITTLLYKDYILIKKMLYLFCIVPLWADLDFINSAKIYCKICSHELKSPSLYAQMLEDHIKIEMTKWYWHLKDLDDLEDFFCYFFEKLKVHCPRCLIFNGWKTLPRQ